MKRKRVFRILLAVIAVLVVVEIGANTVFRWSAAKAIRKIPPMMAPHGIQVAHLYFDGAHMEGFHRCVLTDLRTLVNIRVGDEAQDTITATFRAGALEVDILSYMEKEITFRLKNFRLEFQDARGAYDLPFTQLENATWERQTPVAVGNLREALKEILGSAKVLFQENRSARPFHFKGEVAITIGGKTARAKIFSIETGGYTTLRFDAADIRAAAVAMDIPLAQAEIDIVSTYPLRALDLMEITHTAKETARNTAVTQATVPEDAYRHVLWSYLLARRFGPAFSQMVTDAHETAPGNTPAEHKMDYANNAVGRRYAAEGVLQEALLKRLLADPAVVRKPGDAGPA